MKPPLPIDAALPAIVDSVRARRALVLVAEPGAGKTTRVPPALLDAGLAGDGEILVLEPRRLAARLAARRVAEERGERVGETIGFEVRFDRAVSAATRVRFVTEGILTRRLASDPTLRGVSCVVLDELHERNLHADIALALTARLRATSRPELAIVAMSATLEAQPLAEFLAADVLHVPGRTFPVAIEFDETHDDRPLERRVASALRRLIERGLDGDVLVFLPGAAEIRRAREACAELATREGLLLVALHGDLPSAEQDRAIARAPTRKVILSTNVAETSLTIEGVVAVIDSGLARIARHSPWSGLPSLAVAKVSQASAVQRAGRAGRTRAGLCVRLYGRHDFDTRPAHETPEIQRAELSETVLALLAAGERDPERAMWFERPPAAALQAALELLRRLGAIAPAGTVTDLGRQLLALPLHPRLARLFLAARDNGAFRAGALLTALASEREIRIAARTTLRSTSSSISTIIDASGPSDLLARVEAFEACERDGGGNDACRRHGLDFAAMTAVRRTRDALLRAASKVTRGPGASDARRHNAPRALDSDARSARDPDASHTREDEALLRAVLAAFPDRVAKRRASRSPDVLLATGGAARLGPTSVVHEASWMVVVDAESTQAGVIARLASAIEPEWLFDLEFDPVTEHREVRFDSAAERVEVVSAIRYGALAIDESREPDVRDAEVATVLADAALSRGPVAFCDGDELSRFSLRTRFAAAHGHEVRALDAEAARETLRAMCEGRRSFAELREASLLDALRASLTPKARAELDRLAPETFTLPGGRRLRIHYEETRPPWAESRLQDFFGMREGPKVAGGRVALVLHLNAPSGRAVQVTTDLAGFWERHYPAIRRELMRQYPKHAWPEDPRTASPPAPGKLR